MRPVAKRSRIPFRTVNRRDDPGYDPGLQRHHLLPRQLLSRSCFGPMFDLIGSQLVGFDDFRANGMLLPAKAGAALRLALPLHRGPHRRYNAMLIERVGQIEQLWTAQRRTSPEMALEHALMRFSLLQRALRRRLLDPIGRRFSLNRGDPGQRVLDFSELDAMAETLWGATECIQEAMEPNRPSSSRRAS